MRKLMWFALGFSAACAGCAYMLPDGSVWAFAALFIGIAIVAAIFSRKISDIASAAVVFLGCGMGLLWWQFFDAAYLGLPRTLNDTTQEVQIIANDFPYRSGYGTAVEGIVKLDGKQYKIWTYLNDDMSVLPGDQISGRFRISFILNTDDGGYSYNSGNGIFLSASPRGKITVIPVEGVPIRCYPAYIRHKILTLLEQTFPQDTSGFAKALLLGEDEDIDYETDTAFQVSGIRHIIAVSGLHVSILCGAIYFVTGRKRYITSLVSIFVLLLFAAVAGFTPSITRACIMSVLVMLALLFNKEYDGPTALALSALLMEFVNPLVITSVSFQLSFSCMLGIFLFSGQIHGWILDEKRLGSAKGKSINAKLKRWFAGSVSVTLSAMVFTTPLVACYFGMVSLVGVLTNLLGLWAVTYIFYGVILVCVLGAMFQPVGAAAAWVIAWLIRYVLRLTNFLASLPMAAIYTNRWTTVAWVILCYILLGIYLISKKKRAALPVSVAAISLCFALLSSWISSASGNFSMTVLDVGQGQCILLQNEGKAYMVDCGGEYNDTVADIAAQELLSQGISRLDGIILTHFDADHAGAVENLLTRIKTDVLYLPNYESNELTAREEAYFVNENTVISFGNTRISIFPSLSGNSGNESSMCVLFQTGKYDILITGDRDMEGEAELLSQMVLPDLEVLVAGHHGSKSSTSAALLEATTPDMAMISVGKDNSYGHPSQSVLDRLAEIGCEVHRTDLEGTIIFRG